MASLVWNYNGSRFFFRQAIGYQGFVYEIENLKTGRMYVGRKWFWHKKRDFSGKRYIVESDWKTYYGSSKPLLADLKKQGPLEFERRILRLCETKSECAYFEMEEIIKRRALLRDDYYNKYLGGRVYASRLKHIR